MGYFTSNNLILLSVVPNNKTRINEKREKMDDILKLVLSEQIFESETNTLLQLNNNNNLIQFDMLSVKKSYRSFLDYFGFSINLNKVLYLNMFAFKNDNDTLMATDVFFRNRINSSLIIRSRIVDKDRILPIGTQNYISIQSPHGTHGYFLLTDFDEIRFVNSYFKSGKFF